MLRYVVNTFSRLRHRFCRWSRDLEAVVSRLSLLEEALEEVRLEESRVGVLFHESLDALLGRLEGLRVRSGQVGLGRLTRL